MRYRAKMVGRHPIWVMGEYITKPPRRPCDGAMRPKGHYIDSGGYPGANVAEINIETLCRESGRRDLSGKYIFEKDFLRFDYIDDYGEMAHTYCLAEYGNYGSLDIIDFLTGEILDDPDENRLKVIGNRIDNRTFITDLERIIYQSESAEMPYIPMINVQMGSFPFWRITCRECMNKTLGTMFQTTCSKCGSVADCTLATEHKKESVSV